MAAGGYDARRSFGAGALDLLDTQLMLQGVGDGTSLWNQPMRADSFSDPALQAAGDEVRRRQDIRVYPDAQPEIPAAAPEGDFEARRSAAFLGSSDSMGGLNAVRRMMVKQLGEDPDAVNLNSSAYSIRNLERRLKDNPSAQAFAPQGGEPLGERLAGAFQNPNPEISKMGAQTPFGESWPTGGRGVEAFTRPSFDYRQAVSSEKPDVAGDFDRTAGGAGIPLGQGGIEAFTKGWGKPQPEAAPTPAGGRDVLADYGADPEDQKSAQAAVNDWMQTALRQKLRANDVPPGQPRPLQPQAMIFRGGDGPNQTALAASAVQGVEPPRSPGEALLAMGLLGGRNNTVPGATTNLGFVDPAQLPPLHSRSRVQIGPRWS